MSLEYEINSDAVDSNPFFWKEMSKFRRRNVKYRVLRILYNFEQIIILKGIRI